MTVLRHSTNRRSICSRLLADDGTNFVSAARELKLYKFLKKKKEIIHTHISKQKIECLILKLLQISEDYGTICSEKHETIFYRVRVKKLF